MRTPPKTTKNSDEEPKSQVIRLGRVHAAQLSKLSAQFGCSQAQLVRWALDAMAAKVEASGGKITLPFDLLDESAKRK